ncbi:MAG TPA: UDP-2,3-diacylglucosamine diphosphatase LpxI [Methyloceanibacter sp.]|nr:UDP-2,3-diacylglucosamine diphosphatase LpxI [Methyloceanibacter sp.]
MRGTTQVEGTLGIIAGRGSLPSVIARAAMAGEIPIHLVAIRGETSEEIECFPHTWIQWGEIGKLFSALKDNTCTDLVIIGGVNRPDFDNVRLDLGAIKTLPFLLSLAKGGDDHVLSSVVRFFEEKGYHVHGAGQVLPELLADEGKLSTKAPSAEDKADIATGLEVVRALGRHDIGQAVVVAKGRVLAVEAAEGTDAMLQRCAELRKSGRARGAHQTGVLVKAPKPGQEERIDMPTIGPETMRRAAAAGLAGVAVAAGQVLMAERGETIAAAKANKLFLVGERWDADVDDALGE